MAHVGVEQARALHKAAQQVLRPVELTGHRHRVYVSTMQECSKIRESQYFRPCRKVNAVIRRGSSRNLLAQSVKSVVVHDDPSIGLIYMHIGRSNMWSCCFRERIV